MIVTMKHLRSVPDFGGSRGWCARGARAWFSRHGLDWMTFVREGAPEEVLLGTGCAFAKALVAHAHQVDGGKDGQ